MYSKAIELDKTNHIYFSNRSAAYLTKGDAAKALDDASTCLELNPDFEKGYSRKGAALQGMKKFDESIAVLEQGVTKFPENSNLQKELATVKLVKDSGSSMAQAARSSKASMMAAGSRRKKAAESENLSSFVQQTKFALELQIFALQAQLDLVNGLAAMSDEEKMRLMFQIVDTDHDMKIDARELADAIKRHNADLTFAESVDRAINYVAAFDDNHDARLDFHEFTNFLNTFALTLGVDFHEIAELLILQNLFANTGTAEIEGIAGEIAAEAIDAAVLEKEMIFDVMSDPRMVSLFALFDKVSENCWHIRETFPRKLIF
jgi:tetratricopeptide (TPR) repeat protein